MRQAELPADELGVLIRCIETRPYTRIVPKRLEKRVELALSECMILIAVKQRSGYESRTAGLTGATASKIKKC